MSKQLAASPSTKKISELYTRIAGPNPTLILQPPFQRKLVWNSEHKEKFIESLLMGLPIPEIYIAQSGIDVEKIETQEVVVDGQQRLSTIIQYIDEPEDSNEFGNIVPKYKNLENKGDFLNYTIVIRDLGDISSETIKEIFKRINSTHYGLNQIELHNAIYDGKFIYTAKEILEEITAEDLPFLTESKVSRMEDLYFILGILATIENGGYFSRDSEIEKYIIEFNDKYERSQEIKAEVSKVFDSIKSLALPVDSIWYRKSNFFTLFVELYNHRDVWPSNEELKHKLTSLEESIISNKDLGKENDFSLYYYYMYSGTNSRQARVTRSEILNRYIF